MQDGIKTLYQWSRQFTKTLCPIDVILAKLQSQSLMEGGMIFWKKNRQLFLKRIDVTFIQLGKSGDFIIEKTITQP